MINLIQYENFLSTKKASKELLETQEAGLLISIEDCQTYLKDIEEALGTMNDVSLLVQQEFKEVVEVLVTQALKFIFGDNHSFEIDSKIARNQPEIHLFIVIDGERFSPQDDEFSGGQADVVSFSLRIILWAIQSERTRAMLFFDEPFRNLHGTENAKTIREMVQYLSKTLALQFIIITQDEELVEVADAAFFITKSRGVSTVELMERVRSCDEGHTY